MKRMICFLCVLALLVTTGAAFLLNANDTAPLTFVEAENQDAAYEKVNGEWGSRDPHWYMYGTDANASGGWYQGAVPGGAFVYENLAKTNQITVGYTSCLPLDVTFYYSTNDADWSLAGSGTLPSNGSWSDYTGSQTIVLTNEIPAGATLCMTTGADGATQGSNLDTLSFSYVGPKSFVEAENQDAAYEKVNGEWGSRDPHWYMYGADASASGGWYQGAVPGGAFVYENLVKTNRITVGYASGFPLDVTFYYSTNDTDWSLAGSGTLLPSAGWSDYTGSQTIVLTNEIPEGATLCMTTGADGATQGSNLDTLSFSYVVLKSFVEVEAHDAAYEKIDGVYQSRDPHWYGYGADANASGGYYQAAVAGGAFVFDNVVKANQITVGYTSSLDLGVTFYYSTNGTDWSLAGSGTLPANGSWFDYTASQTIVLTNEIPEGAKVCLISDSHTENRASNLDTLTFSYLVDSLPYYDATQGKNPLGIDAGKDYAIQFVADAPVSGIVIPEVPSWGGSTGDLTLTVYKWDVNYAKTLTGTAVASKAFESIPDASKLEWNFDTALEAGEYLVVIANTTPVADLIGLYVSNAGSTFDYAVNYLNGEITDTTAAFVVKFAERIAPSYTAPSAPGDWAPPREPQNSFEAENKDLALENGSEASLDYGVADDASASGGKWQGAKPNYEYIYNRVILSNQITIRYTTANYLDLTISYQVEDGAEWKPLTAVRLDSTGGWSNWADLTVCVPQIPEGANVKISTNAGAEGVGANLDSYTFAQVEAKSTVEFEKKDQALENGAPANMNYLVQEDSVASAGKMQGYAPGYVYIYHNIIESNQVEISSCGFFDLPVAFYYSIDGGATWTKCGEGTLTQNSAWGGAYAKTVIRFDTTIPAGASIKVEGDADNNAEPPRGANVDLMVFSLVSDEGNADTADSLFATMLVMMVLAVVALPVLRKRVTL